MSLTLFRWKSGSGGDTVMNIVLQSNPQLQSQIRFLGLSTSQTVADSVHVKSFPYSEISKMSLLDYNQVDRALLEQQLNALYQSDPEQHWLLKTHCYLNFDWPTIDITVRPQMLPFMVKASLAKNSIKANMITQYHPLIEKIQDEQILYKFDCYNLASDSIHSVGKSNMQLTLDSILGRWSSLKTALQQLGFNVSAHCENYYNTWLSNNQKFLPSKQYIKLSSQHCWDHNTPGLSIEERYCLLALSNQKFKLLND
jgi:hypothetical protein